MLDELFKQTKEKMQSSVTALGKHLSKMRTGRASAALVEDIRIDCYGEKLPLSQLATISVPESGLIVVHPWDPNLHKQIENGIVRFGDGLMPASDGHVIRITIPPLSEERRKRLVATASKSCEEARATIRNIRKDSRNHIRDLEKEKQVSEDEASVALDELQELTDGFMEQIDEMQESKQKDLMQF